MEIHFQCQLLPNLPHSSRLEPAQNSPLLHTPIPKWLTCEITTLTSNTIFSVTFIYAYNTPAERTSLWRYIGQESRKNSSTPWVLMGDFNAIMRPGDRKGGDETWHNYLDEFSECIQQAELIQIPYMGLKFSWHNGQKGGHTIQKKLDWLFCNTCFLTKLPEVNSVFQHRHVSVHSAMLLNSHNTRAKQRYPPFKFLNL